MCTVYDGIGRDSERFDEDFHTETRTIKGWIVFAECGVLHFEDLFLFQTEQSKTLQSLILTIENHLNSGRDLTNVLPNEPQIRHQMEQLIDIRNKIKEQFDVISLHFHFFPHLFVFYLAH